MCVQPVSRVVWGPGARAAPHGTWSLMCVQPGSRTCHGPRSGGGVTWHVAVSRCAQRFVAGRSMCSRECCAQRCKAAATRRPWSQLLKLDVQTRAGTPSSVDRVQPRHAMPKGSKQAGGGPWAQCTVAQPLRTQQPRGCSPCGCCQGPCRRGRCPFRRGPSRHRWGEEPVAPSGQRSSRPGLPWCRCPGGGAARPGGGTSTGKHSMSYLEQQVDTQHTASVYQDTQYSLVDTAT